MINAMNCSMLESPSNSDYNDTDNGVSKPIVSESTIKHLILKTCLCQRTARNLVRRE